MIAWCLALAVVALGVAFRLLWRQNRHLRELHAAIRSGQGLLDEQGGGSRLPAWPALVAAVNALIRDNAALRRQRSDQLTQLEATLGQLREAVLIVDEANYIHLANRALHDIFPTARGLLNLRLELIVRSAAFLDYARATRAGEMRPRQEFELTDGARTTWIEASGAQIPSPDGRARWALFVIYDITRQRQLERMRRDFVANASHELRTPLSLIQGCVETLVEGHETMAVADRDRFLRTIQRHGTRLSALIADLLTLSRLESATPRLTLAPLALTPYLEQLLAETRARPAATGRPLALEAGDDLGSVHVDEEKLTQVLTNLLDNALRHTPAGTPVVLTARTLAASDEVEFTVRDPGPGIPAEDLPHIFERFYRVEKGRARANGGTGLGLSIVKHIVQLHGGRVWAESGVGQGTAVFVRLPRAAAPPPPARAPAG